MKSWVDKRIVQHFILLSRLQFIYMIIFFRPFLFFISHLLLHL